MNGAIEEGGKVAVSVVDSMKSQPLAVALVVVNVMFLLVGGYFAHVFFGELGTASIRKDNLIIELSHAVAACPGAIVPPREVPPINR